MKILITGANGQLGREIARQFQNRHQLHLYTRQELDITDYAAVLAAVSDVRPDAVINAAAYTNVERAEDEWEIAFKVNALGAQNLALACRKYGAKLVHISTDYVFDGAKTAPYREYDTPNPLSVYGQSKLLGEQLVREAGAPYFILRTSWLYGDGPNFVRTMLRLAEEKDMLRVVADQQGTPTYTKDLVRVIEKLLPTDFYGLYHASNNGCCTWYEFARQIFAFAGKNVTIQPITTAEYPVKAARPRYSVLDNTMLKLRGLDVMRPWQETLQEYIAGGCR